MIWRRSYEPMKVGMQTSFESFVACDEQGSQEDESQGDPWVPGGLQGLGFRVYGLGFPNNTTARVRTP